MQLAAVSVLWQLDSDDCCSTTAAECCIDPTGTTQAGNPLTNLNLFAGAFSGNSVAAPTFVNPYIGSTSIFATPTYNPYASSLANSSSALITQPAKPLSTPNLSGGVSSYSTPNSKPVPRTVQLQNRINEEIARDNLREANYVQQQLAVEIASRTGAYPDQSLYQSYTVQVQRNAGAIQNALEYPQRKVLGALGTSPEELAAAAAYAGGDAYVPANRLVEVAPGIYRQPLVYAPERNPNYSKYRLGTDIISDPLTYLPAGVAAAVNRGKAVKTLFSTGDELLDAARATSSGGRLGSASTRQHVSEVAAELERRGWKVEFGGGQFKEEYIPGPGGARKGSAYPDVTATKNGRTLRINTVDTLSDAVTPTAREATNAAKIRQLKPDEHLLLVPKPKR